MTSSTRPPIASVLLAAFVLVACTRSAAPPTPAVRTNHPDPDPEPAPSAPAPDGFDPACATMRANLADELCDDAPTCEDADLSCSQQLDLDGDGTPDDVTFAEVDGKLVLRVTFGRGETSVLTEPFELAELPDLGQPWPSPSDEAYPAELSWLAAWSVAKRDGDELVFQSRSPAGPALGDALWLSGSDAAAMLMLTARGWLLVELGY